jgi:hypothetical protein
MPSFPKQFKVPSLDPKTQEAMRPYTEMLDFFFRLIWGDIKKQEEVDYTKEVGETETGNTVIGEVHMAGSMTPDLTGVYVCDLGDPLYNGQRTYSLTKFLQTWWIWWDTASSRWYLSYAKGAKTGYRWYTADTDLAATWTAEGGVLS